MLRTVDTVIKAQATWLIAGVLVAAYLASGFLPTSGMVVSGDSGLDVEEPWRLLSYTLVHVSPFHLLFNILVLAAAGIYIERNGNASLVLSAFVSGALAGAVAFIAVSTASGFDDGILAGASASAFAVAGAALVRSAAKWLIPVVLVVLITGSIGSAPGAAIAHIAGFGAGIALAWLWKARSMKANPLLVKVQRSGYSSLSPEEKREFSTQNNRPK